MGFTGGVLLLLGRRFGEWGRFAGWFGGPLIGGCTAVVLLEWSVGQF